VRRTELPRHHQPQTGTEETKTGREDGREIVEIRQANKKLKVALSRHFSVRQIRP
jgi:hypothetical protein